MPLFPCSQWKQFELCRLPAIHGGRSVGACLFRSLELNLCNTIAPVFGDINKYYLGMYEKYTKSTSPAGTDGASQLQDPKEQPKTKKTRAAPEPQERAAKDVMFVDLLKHVTDASTGASAGGIRIIPKYNLFVHIRQILAKQTMKGLVKTYADEDPAAWSLFLIHRFLSVSVSLSCCV